MHPDHKMAEILLMKVKELELTVPYIEAEHMAILNAIPSFLKHELNKITRPHRLRSKEEDEALDLQQENKRKHNFQNSMSRVVKFSDLIKEKTHTMKTKLRDNLEQSQDNPKAFAAYLQQIDVACDQISEYIFTLEDEFRFVGDCIHPSQSALISVVQQYNALSIECEQLQKMISLKNGELNGYEEINNTRPKRQIASSSGPPPGFENKSTKNTKAIMANNESFQFEDIEKDFMQYAAQSYSEEKIQENVSSDTDEIVPKMIDILQSFKQKTYAVQLGLKVQQNGMGNYALMKDLEAMMELVDSMNSKMIQCKQIIGPDSKYISRLESRYVQVMGLYKMKYAEVENKADMLYQSENHIQGLRDELNDMDYRLGAVMSSAVSNVETRMEAFNEMGVKIQTFPKVMKMIEDTFNSIGQACHDITESVEKDLFDIIGDGFDEDQLQNTHDMVNNVVHACDYIIKAFDDIGQEFDGVAQFVHPDREMTERLQNELIALYDQQVSFECECECDMKDESAHNDVSIRVVCVCVICICDDDNWLIDLM